MKKKFTAAGLGGAILMGSVILTATPAQAAEGRSLGPKDCSGGGNSGAATELRSTGPQRHKVNTNYKTFAGAGRNFYTYTFYSGVVKATYSYGEATADYGAIAYGRIYCDF